VGIIVLGTASVGKASFAWLLLVSQYHVTRFSCQRLGDMISHAWMLHAFGLGDFLCFIGVLYEGKEHHAQPA